MSSGDVSESIEIPSHKRKVWAFLGYFLLVPLLVSPIVVIDPFVKEGGNGEPMIYSGIIYLVAIAFWLTFRRLPIRPMRSFNRKWPPISEDEYLARYEAMVGRAVIDREVALKVRRIVGEQLGIPVDQIYPEQDFVRDLDC